MAYNERHYCKYCKKGLHSKLNRHQKTKACLGNPKNPNYDINYVNLIDNGVNHDEQQNVVKDIYTCEICPDYIGTTRKSDYTKHIRTKKHQNNRSNLGSNNQNSLVNCRKNKQYICRDKKRLVWETFTKCSDGNIPYKIECPCCNQKEILSTKFHCAHIISEYNGGSINIYNLIPTCDSCNNKINKENMHIYMLKHNIYNRALFKCATIYFHDMLDDIEKESFEYKMDHRYLKKLTEYFIDNSSDFDLLIAFTKSKSNFDISLLQMGRIREMLKNILKIS